MRWSLVFVAFLGLLLVLGFLPGRGDIPPHIQPDYCYQLIAADRLYDGLGLTSLQPLAPNQPWTWQYDFGFLTQWPIGYPLLVCGLRYTFGLSTVEACQWISVIACATALIGWFTWISRCAPRGVTGKLLAVVAAGCSVSTASLINPSTDALLVAVVPFALMSATLGLTQLARADDVRTKSSALVWLALAGFLAGGLFWIRYASLFLPVAIGVYLLIERRRDRAIRWPHVGVYALSAALPILALLLMNYTLGSGDSPRQQLNLGHGIGFDFSWALLATAWWRFTDLGFYDYHRLSHWVFALWPALIAGAALLIPSVRRAIRSFFQMPAVCLSAIVVTSLLGMLIGATVLFGGKYNYVGLDRYYESSRALYFLLFVAPLLMIPRRVVRAVVCVALLLACSWTLQQEWHRPYKRWLAANREVTPYGQWTVCFRPGAAELYEWISRQEADNMILLSNFREYITLETKIPVLPIPDSIDTLNAWVRRVCASRGITQPRILFVLDPDNRWRSHWLAEPADVIQTLGLTPRRDAPPAVSAYLYEYTGYGANQVGCVPFWVARSTGAAGRPWRSRKTTAWLLPDRATPRPEGTK